MSEKVRDKDGERDRRHGCFLKPCCDQAHTVAPFAEAEESFDSDTDCVVLVSRLLIGLLLVFVFRTASQLRTRYTDMMFFAECDVCPRSIYLVNKYPFRPSAGTFMVFVECFLKLFGFIEGFKGNPGHTRIPVLIKDDLKLCSELCRCFDLTPDDRSDPRLGEAYNAVFYAVYAVIPHVFLLLVESEDDKISVNHLPVSHRVAFGHIILEIAKVTFHVNELVALLHDLRSQAFSEFNQKRWLKRSLVLEAWYANKVLKIRSLRDCLSGLSVRKHEPLLNDEGSRGFPERMCRTAALAGKVYRIQVLKLLSWDQISHADPFVVLIELHTAALIEIVKPDLRRCTGSIHGSLLTFLAENARLFRSERK